MFLKSIEIRGFKSFADKTEITFKKGITSIVGPNGSGKSNISDAVMWVLGEQSIKTLRGAKMEDVIFNGTEYRKPVGLAQVSLTLDNTDNELPIDYADVTVSRRLYRSGESEYCINGSKCRLKDVQELFMDTGIGRDGYSIIGQGKIDAILSGKPDERRNLFEEAAGIIKFKTRKEESEKKLENTDQNILRIDDIIDTYKERLKPLKEESEKAKKFLELSKELKEKEVNLIIQSIDKYKEKIDGINGSLSASQNELKKIKNDYASCKNDLDKFKNEFDELEKKQSFKKQKYYEMKEEKQKKESDIILFNERLNNFDSHIENIKNQIQNSNEKVKLSASKKAEYEKDFESLSSDQKDLKNRICSKEKDISEDILKIHEEENVLKITKDDEIELLKDISDANNNILLLRNGMENTDSKLKDLKNSFITYNNSINMNNKTECTIKEKINGLESDIEFIKNETEKKRKEISSLNDIAAKDNSALNELNQSLSKSEANFSVLTNLQNNLEGYNRAVKRLMTYISQGRTNAAALFKEKCFVLGEIIQVKKEYETALSIALGTSISDVITDNEKTAQILIEYLKRNNMGRATFLPLTTVRPRKIKNTSSFDKIEGYIGIASELISFDSRFKNAVDYILGRTVICSDMECALKIAKVTGYSYKIVTIPGEVISTGGSLTGGSILNKSGSIIARKREIQEFKEKIKISKEKISALSSRINANKNNINDLNETILSYKDEIYGKNVELTKYKENLSSIAKENAKLHETLIICSNEVKNSENIIKRYKCDIDTKSDNVKKLKMKSENNESSISNIENGIKEKNDFVSQKRDELTGLKIEKAKIDEMINSKKSDICNIDSKIKEIESELLKLKNEMEKYKSQKEEIILAAGTNTSDVSALTDSINEHDDCIKKIEFEKNKIKEKINERQTAFDENTLLINEKEGSIHKEELAFTKLKTEQDAQYAKLNDEMQLTYAEALKYKIDDFNMENFKLKVQSIKKDIASLGSVNVGSIEEYKELTLKYTFLSEQKGDLSKSKDELINVIDEMTKKMKAVFKSNFEILRHNFNDTFRELFKGGSADLIIASGDELNGTIDITVQPPGKKLQNLNLLSGGEKVLSAIALLFAILKMKPSPFCMLDEIEAALDDANVKRYADYLCKLSGNIQFIVITHRKGTMEASDAMYGVTMEEKGVSKVVSVDFSETED